MVALFNRLLKDGSSDKRSVYPYVNSLLLSPGMSEQPIPCWKCANIYGRCLCQTASLMKGLNCRYGNTAPLSPAEMLHGMEETGIILTSCISLRHWACCLSGSLTVLSNACPHFLPAQSVPGTCFPSLVKYSVA
jgi:hypothetical protein